MLNEHQLEYLPERIYRRLEKVNFACLELIGTKIKEIGKLTPSMVHKLQSIYLNGANMDAITEALAAVSNKNISEIYEIYDIVAKENYNYSKPFYQARDIPFIPYEDNLPLQRYVKAQAAQTVNTYNNLTQHTAFTVFGTDGNIAPLFKSNTGKIATSLSDTYTKIMDLAVQRASMGVSDYQSEMRGTLRALADSGIKGIDYATGYTRRLDTSVRQNILWGLKQINQGTADLVGREFGADGYEISYHTVPRPSHADMGARQYAIGKARVIDGVYYPSFSDVEELLKDYNCLHFKFSILLGLSEPAYSAEELEKLKENDKRVTEFEGKKYTAYESSQMQRRIETEIRRSKDNANIAKAAGDDTLRREYQERLNILAHKYKAFSDTAGLPYCTQRMSVSNFHRVKTQAELKKFKPNLTDQPKSDILKLYKEIDAFKTISLSDLNYPLNVESVISLAKKYNIDVSGINFRIETDNEYFRIPYCGRTDKIDIGRVDLYPHAFTSEEVLLSTILHERTHYKQLIKYGIAYCDTNYAHMEKIAYRFDQLFTKILLGGQS